MVLQHVMKFTRKYDLSSFLQSLRNIYNVSNVYMDILSKHGFLESWTISVIHHLLYFFLTQNVVERAKENRLPLLGRKYQSYVDAA